VKFNSKFVAKLGVNPTKPYIQCFFLKISQNFSKGAKKVANCYFETFKALKHNYLYIEVTIYGAN
jgi:hypothetical protein